MSDTRSFTATELPIWESIVTGVKERLENGDGNWVTCTGCHEPEDGYDNGYYPNSNVFGCKLGGGCGECGGIGAIWDTTDYGAMANAVMADDARGVAQSEPDEYTKGYRAGWRDMEARVAGAAQREPERGEPDSDDRRHWIDFVITRWNEADFPVERRLEEALHSLAMVRFPPQPRDPAYAGPVPRLTDNDEGEINVTLDGKELRGWSYKDDSERRIKMLAAREYVEGWHDGRQA